MNSLGRRNKAQDRFSMRRLGSLALLLGLPLLNAGCNSVKQYSINSYQGPMPMTDLRYLPPPEATIPH